MIDFAENITMEEREIVHQFKEVRDVLYEKLELISKLDLATVIGENDERRGRWRKGLER